MKADTLWLILAVAACLILDYLIKSGSLTPMLYAIDRPYP